MGKSLRSNVKKTYRGLRRQVMEPAASSRTLAQAASQYSLAGLPLPDPAASGVGTGTGGNRPKWSHGGFVPVTSFVPTPPGVRLNRVHGPLAEGDQAAAAERNGTPPKQDHVGEREEPVVVAKDLPLKLPVLFEVVGGAAPGTAVGVLPMGGVAAAAPARGAAVGSPEADGGAMRDEPMAGGGVPPKGSRRRKDWTRKKRGGVKKGSKPAKSRHPLNKVSKLNRAK